MGSDTATVGATFKHIDKASDQQAIKERFESDNVDAERECDVVMARQKALVLARQAQDVDPLLERGRIELLDLRVVQRLGIEAEPAAHPTVTTTLPGFSGAQK